MVRWPHGRRPRDSGRTVAATIATATVKAQALALVGELRATVDQLEAILREEGDTSQTVAGRREGDDGA